MSIAAAYDYPKLSFCINGKFIRGGERLTEAVINPATEAVLGEFPHANDADLALALAAAEQGFQLWRKTPALERSQKLRRVADLIRERGDDIAPLITLELGKPYRESLNEIATAAAMFDWAAEEARRTYGRTIPARSSGMRLLAERVPVGPVAGFSGWNAPLITPSRKIAGALGAGCSIIMKPAEKTPATAMALMQCILDADIPPSVVSMVLGNPVKVSKALLASDVIRLVTFTGSIPVGKQLTAMAAQTMKRTIMELGGHAPVIVCDDADIDAMAKAAAAAKFRNSGQICVSPTRFFIQRKVYQRFVDLFVAEAKKLVMGNGFDEATTMGPVANSHRLTALQSLIDDALDKGATVACGGKRIGDVGHFLEPTVLCDLTADARAMTEEPFGPLALMLPYDRDEDVIAKANSLPLGLAAYVCTTNSKRMTLFRDNIDVGTLAFNHFVASLPETPFGGVKDSGLGSEGGIEGLQAFQQVKFISEA